MRTPFPKQKVEIMEKQAMAHYGMTQPLRDMAGREKLAHNTDLLKTIHEMNSDRKGVMSELALVPGNIQ